VDGAILRGPGPPRIRVAPGRQQPITHVSAQAPRTLLLAAREDPTVDPQRNSVALADRLQHVGVSVRLRLPDHVNHVTVIAALASPLRALAPVRDEVTGFVLA
jgi:acetyl esterase/lipase